MWKRSGLESRALYDYRAMNVSHSIPRYRTIGQMASNVLSHLFYYFLMARDRLNCASANILSFAISISHCVTD